MEINKGIPVADRPSEEIVESLDTCCICGTKLQFQHKTDFILWVVREEAFCNSCGIRNKVNSFILQ